MRGGAAIDPIYEIGSPIFDKITIKLNNDYYLADEFVIETIIILHKPIHSISNTGWKAIEYIMVLS